MEQVSPLLPLPDNWLQSVLTPEEEKAVKLQLSNPLFQKYLKILYYHSIQEVALNEAETPEQIQKLVTRFNKLKGIQYIITFLLSNFEESKKEVKKV